LLAIAFQVVEPKLAQVANMATTWKLGLSATTKLLMELDGDEIFSGTLGHTYHVGHAGVELI
jgi:hypothetical protein